MSFSEVLRGLLINGSRYERWLWDDKFISLQVPDRDSKMTEPYIFLTTIVQGSIESVAPYTPTMDDMLKEDWAEWA